MKDSDYELPATVRVFFNKPKRPLDLSVLISDLESSTKQVALASAWLTNSDIVEAFIKSTAPIKHAFINGADMTRGSRKAVSRLMRYFEGEYKEPEKNAIVQAGLYVLGSQDWKEGVMHHKFIVADDVIWTGSYNFTFQAQTNYENLIRLQGEEVASLFHGEVMDLAGDAVLYHGSTQWAISWSAFRCAHCEKLFTLDEMWGDYEADIENSSTIYCVPCAEKLQLQSRKADL